jgi:hypothetical protein
MGISVKLGKIMQAEFGFGGYNDSMIGLSLTFGGKGWGIGDFMGFWADDPSPHAKWDMNDQNKQFAEVMRKVRKFLRDANVDSVSQLKGKPVEISISDETNTLYAWRILTEVI